MLVTLLLSHVTVETLAYIACKGVFLNRKWGSDARDSVEKVEGALSAGLLLTSSAYPTKSTR